VQARHASLGHNLNPTTVDTLTEWFRCEDDPAAIALLVRRQKMAPFLRRQFTN
jgi:hypothetical protein